MKISIIEKIEKEINEINNNLPFHNIRLVGRFIYSNEKKFKRLIFYKEWIELNETIFPYEDDKENILYDDEKEILYNVVIKVINNKTYDEREKVYLNNLENCLRNHKKNLNIKKINDVFNYVYNLTKK